MKTAETRMDKGSQPICLSGPEFSSPCTYSVLLNSCHTRAIYYGLRTATMPGVRARAVFLRSRLSVHREQMRRLLGELQVIGSILANTKMLGALLEHSVSPHAALPRHHLGRCSTGVQLVLGRPLAGASMDRYGNRYITVSLARRYARRRGFSLNSLSFHSAVVDHHHTFP